MKPSEDQKDLDLVIRCPNCLSQDLIFTQCGCVNCIFCFHAVVCDKHIKLYLDNQMEIREIK
jgi:hypothetical protein